MHHARIGHESWRGIEFHLESTPFNWSYPPRSTDFVQITSASGYVTLVIDDGEVEDDDDVVGGKDNYGSNKRPLHQQTIYDDMGIFSIAPKSATDAAGASILSAILTGKHWMLVDVRDAEVTRDPEPFCGIY
mmetsp:Transcript_24195/g.43368  ORF Transcript_24195/g.43368 Transcript_24195/m.43368 type:complete len:132 (-) Transcript_24195:899-1294(-)